MSLILLGVCNVSARAGWPALLNIDSFAIWMFKAKWVLHQPLRPVPPEFWDPALSYSHQDYPLSFPFLVAGLYAAIGRIDEQLLKTILIPIYLALIAVSYSALRNMNRRALAVVVTALFVASPTLSANAGFGVAETPLILAYTCGLVMLLRYLETSQAGCLWLAGFFSAVAAFTKNEGLALLPVIGVAMLMSLRTRVQLRHIATAAVVMAVSIGPWLLFRMHLPRTHEDYGTKLTSAQVIIQNLPRLGRVLREFLGRCFNAQSAGLLWMVFLLAAAIGWRGFQQRSVLILWFILIAQLALYIGTFLVTPWNLDELLPMISGKLLVQASPVAALLIKLHLQHTKWDADVSRVYQCR